MSESYLSQSGDLDRVLDMREARIQAIKVLQQSRDSIVFVLWQKDSLIRQDFFTLADLLEEENPERDIDLVVHSGGGNGEAGFRIGYTFQQWAKRRNLSFRVLIPLYAKSAATILALGVNEIVMGLSRRSDP